MSFRTRSRLRPSVYFNYIKLIIKFLGLVFVWQRTQQFTLYLRVLCEVRHQWPRSKAWVSCNSLAVIASSKPPGCMDICLMCLCCQVEVSATDWSLVQRSRTERGVSECDCEASIMRRPCPSKGLLRHEGGIMKLMIDIATSVCWTIFNLSVACCSRILKFLYYIKFTNFRNTCLQTASFILDAVRTEL